MAVLAAITVGVLVSRGYPQAGFVISVTSLAALFISGIRRALGGVLRYRHLPPLSRAWIALQGVQLIILVNSITVHRVAYFPVLLVLAAEYLIWDKQVRR